MVEAVVSFSLQKINQFITSETTLVSELKIQIEKAVSDLEKMQPLFKTADACSTHTNEMLSKWVLDVRQVSRAFEDAITTYAASAGTIFVIKYFKKRKFASQVNKISRKISELSSTTMKHQLLEELKNVIDDRSSHLWLKRQTFCGKDADKELVGIEERTRDLVASLTKENEFCRVAAICGMGGLGKTTIARSIYHNREIKDHFDCFSWVYISHQCQPADVWRKLLIDLTSPSDPKKDQIERMGEEELIHSIREVLESKKCLVVLDDIWTDETWDHLAFPIETMKGTILLTTRNKRLISRVDQGLNPFLHEPGCLDDGESWDLFEKKAKFKREYLYDNTRKKELGKEMVKHCAGLPFAIVLLAGVLSSMSTVPDWEIVHRNVKNYINDGHIEEGLRNTKHLGVSWLMSLSYDELPYELKSCFLLLANFPQNSEISVKEVCQMWIAEGFISSTHLHQEDVAYIRFLDLVDRFMVQVEKCGLTGRLKTCRIHDLLRDFCLSRAEKDKFLQVIDFHNRHKFVGTQPDDQVSVHNVQRIAVHLNSNISDELDPIIENTDRGLRSFICFNPIRDPFYEQQMLKSLFSSFHLLRVLKFRNLVQAKLFKWPKQIGELTDLRFLSLKNCHASELPSSIRNLRRLQYLDLRTNWSVCYPNVICELKQLRHLYLPKTSSIKGDNKLWLGSLSSLQTLVNVPSKYSSLDDLSKLKKLRKLSVHIDSDLTEFLEPVNSTLNHLQSLAMISEIRIGAVDIAPIISMCPKVVKLHLELPLSNLPANDQLPQLIKLTLRRTYLDHDPMALLEKLPFLRILVLGENAFNGNQMVCSAGGFPSLESLSIIELENLNQWNVEAGAFPSLSQLHIEACQAMSQLADGLRFINSLEKVMIKAMRNSFKERIQSGADARKVEHVRDIEFAT